MRKESRQVSVEFEMSNYNPFRERGLVRSILSFLKEIVSMKEKLNQSPMRLKCAVQVDLICQEVRTCDLRGHY